MKYGIHINDHTSGSLCVSLTYLPHTVLNILYLTSLVCHMSVQLYSQLEKSVLHYHAMIMKLTKMNADITQMVNIDILYIIYNTY